MLLVPPVYRSGGRGAGTVGVRVPCVLLGVSVSWFDKWIARAGNADGLHTDTDRHRAQPDAAVATAFTAAKESDLPR